MIGRLVVIGHVLRWTPNALEKSHISHTSAANDGCLDWALDIFMGASSPGAEVFPTKRSSARHLRHLRLVMLNHRINAVLHKRLATQCCLLELSEMVLRSCRYTFPISIASGGGSNHLQRNTPRSPTCFRSNLIHQYSIEQSRLNVNLQVAEIPFCVLLSICQSECWVEGMCAEG
jgi:hypothetical protein